jgi:signal transduction histidine kinase
MSFASNISIEEYLNAPEFAPLPDVFGTIFPFYIAVDRDLKILHIGPVLQRLYPEIKPRDDFADYFVIDRPHIPISFAAIVSQSRSLFSLKAIANDMFMKTQIIHAEFAETILFLGSPWITDIAKLQQFNLKLTDFPLHDPVIDFLFFMQTQNASLVDARRLAKKLADRQDEIQNALEKEKELHELKSKFISTASHEFRTPLGVISSSAGMLEDYGSKLDENKKIKHFERIQRAVKHMTRLLEDVLLIEKIEVGKLDCNRAPIELLQVCADLAESVAFGMRAENRLIIDLEPLPQTADGEPIPIVMDEKLVVQILTNLLSNAVKYSPEGKPVYFTLKFNDDRAIFQIRDEGIGISPEDLAKLFDSFHRGNNVSNIQGTGLGLSIVKNCVEVHGGEITVNSELGVGTVFTVNLPLTAGDSSY